MYSYLFNNSFCKIEDVNFKHSVLWVINNDKKPPHIGFSNNNKYFSLKANGLDLGLDTKSVLSFLNNKKTPFILVQLLHDINKSNLFSIFESFKLNEGINHTCLTPILKTLNLEHQSLLLPDLLSLLRENNKIKNVACFNQQGNQVGIVKYSKEDIIKRIYEIKNIQR